MQILPTELHVFHQILISLGLGLLVGLQREWSESPVAGIRSFSLITIFGTLIAILSDSFGHWLIGFGIAATTLMLVLSHLSNRRVVDLEVHRELVTETAILLMFCCGLLVKTGPVLLAASVAGIVAIILHLKTELHGIVSRFNREEIRSILQFVLLTLVILPVIPNKAYGPFDFFNPYNVWLMVVLIVGIGLVGYLMHKYFGDKAGVFLCGLFGGLLSSTATTLSYSKKSIEGVKDSTGFSAIVILIAWATLYWRVFLELAITSPDFNSIRIPLIFMSITSIIPLLWTLRKNKASFSYSQIPPNPSELRTALIFALMYAGVLLASSFLKEKYGNSGLNVLAVIFGITDVDAITLSTGRLVKLISNMLMQANQKDYGREVTFKDLVLAALPKLSQKDIEKLQENCLSEMEKVERALSEFNKKNETKLSMSEFLVRKLGIN